MKYMSLTVQEAYDYVKERRPKIAPNIAFMGQLLEYQKRIRGITDGDKFKYAWMKYRNKQFV